jgi:serine protease AprX
MLHGFVRGTPRCVLGLVACASWLAISGCASHRHLARPGEDPYDRITVARFDAGATSARRTRDLPRSAYRPARPTRRSGPAPGPHASRLHPLLSQWLIDSLGTKQDTLLVTFEDGVVVRRFPEPDMSLPRNAPPNLTALAHAAAMRDSLLGRRASRYTTDSLDLVQHFGAQVLERFWLGQVLRVVLPLDQVTPLSNRPGVIYIQPVHSGEPPPQGGPTPSTGDEVAIARGRIASDQYFAWPPISSYGWMSLLDTGVQFTHELLLTGNHIGIRGDCVNSKVDPLGHGDCVTPDPLKPFDPAEQCGTGHGTSSAAIMVGNDVRGDSYRGVTAGTLDCFRVYEGCPPTLNSAAVLHGFQDAVSNLDRVICAEVAADSTDLSAIAIFADHAYDAGAVVIAANGNKTSPSTGTGTMVKSPAYARKVIGVGGYEVTLTPSATILQQSWGPTWDNRAKPDIQAPSNTETARGSATSSITPSQYWNFTGTSGAAPYGAGAAALLRNWLKWAANITDPGQIYAQLILSGRQPFPFSDPKVGAGPIELPTSGWGCFGKVTIGSGSVVDVPIEITQPGIQRIEAALWWPEELKIDAAGNRVPSHNVIQLFLLDPLGNVRGTSDGVTGVFQRTSAANTQTTGGTWAGGTWKLEIIGELVPFGPQDVYWTAAMRR